jgi:hypothetical protein
MQPMDKEMVISLFTTIRQICIEQAAEVTSLGKNILAYSASQKLTWHGLLEKLDFDSLLPEQQLAIILVLHLGISDTKGNTFFSPLVAAEVMGISENSVKSFIDYLERFCQENVMVN